MINARTCTMITQMLLVIIFCSLVGCSNQSSRYDHRLAEADSVLRHHPDSALQMLDAMDANALSRKADRAYYALLLSQARYRTYIRATSDSLINIALNYYQRHKIETEKLTRSYIYKGGVMEELEQPKGAMSYYKRALTTVAPDDYFNQGYIRLRIGRIYRDNLVADSSDIAMFKEGLRFFKMVPDSTYMLYCLSNIGSTYVTFNEDSMLAYLEQAEVLALQLHNDDELQTIQRYLAERKMFSENPVDVETSKRIALEQLNKDMSSIDKDDFLMVAAYTLARQNKSDSAMLYLRAVQDDSLLLPGQRVFYDRCLAQLALSKGDIGQYQHYFERADHLSDSLSTNEVQQQLREVEAKYDNEALKYEKLRYKIFWVISLLVTGLIVSVLAILLIVARKKSAQRKRQLQESNDTIERMAGDSARLTTLLQDNRAMSEELKQVIRHQIDVFTLLVEQHYTQFTRAPKKFSELFQKSYDVNRPDKSFWTGLRAYADSVCGGIITHTLTDCPELSKTDVNFLSLYCCDLPSTVIMVCMGYNDVHSVYNKKRRVAEALQLDGSLDDYVQHFKPGDVAEQEV